MTDQVSEHFDQPPKSDPRQKAKSLAPISLDGGKERTEDFNSEGFETVNSRFDFGERPTKPFEFAESALEQLLEKKVELIEREFEEVYATRLNKYCEDFVSREKTYKSEVDVLHSEISKLKTEIANLSQRKETTNKPAFTEGQRICTIPEEDADWETAGDEQQQFLQRLEEETEHILFRKGLDGDREELKALARQSPEAKSPANSKSTGQGKRQDKERLRVINDKIKEESQRQKLEKEIKAAASKELEALRRELSEKTAEIGRLKSAMSIKLKSLSDDKKDLEEQLRKERTLFEKRAKMLEAEGSQLVEQNKRLSCELLEARAEIAKLALTNKQLEESEKNVKQMLLSASENNKPSLQENELTTQRAEMEKRATLKSNPQTQSAKINETQTRQILKLSKPKTAFLAEKAAALLKEETDDFRNEVNLTELILENSQDPRKSLEVARNQNCNDQIARQRTPKKFKAKKSFSREHTFSAKEQNSQASKNQKKQLKHSLPLFESRNSRQIQQSQELRKSSKLSSAVSKPTSVGFAQKYQRIANEIKTEGIELKSLKDLFIFQYFEIPFEEDSKDDKEAKLFRSKIEQAIENDELSMNNYLKTEFYFLNHFLKQVLRPIGNPVIKSNLSNHLKAIVKGIVKLWKLMYVKYADRISFFEEFMQNENINELKTQLSQYQSNLEAFYSQGKCIFDLIQTRDLKKNLIYKLARCLNDLNVFYQKSYHNLKAVQKTVEELERVLQSQSENLKIYYKGVEIAYVLETDSWEIDYVQRLKIRADVRNRLSAKNHFN